MSDLERYAELWKTHHGYDDFYLEKNEKQEFQSLKDKIEQDLEKVKKYDKKIQFWINEGVSVEKAEAFQNDIDDAFLKECIEVESNNTKLEQEIESLKDTIEDFHRESKHSAEALSTLKQELQVKVLEIVLLKEENKTIIKTLPDNVHVLLDIIGKCEDFALKMIPNEPYIGNNIMRLIHKEWKGI